MLFREASSRPQYWDKPELGDHVRILGKMTIGTVTSWERDKEWYVWVDFQGYWLSEDKFIVIARPPKLDAEVRWRKFVNTVLPVRFREGV